MTPFWLIMLVVGIVALAAFIVQLGHWLGATPKLFYYGKFRRFLG